jgi:hypothetical protein
MASNPAPWLFLAGGFAAVFFRDFRKPGAQRQAVLGEMPAFSTI